MAKIKKYCMMGMLMPTASQLAPVLYAKVLSCWFNSCLIQARFGSSVIIMATELAREAWTLKAALLLISFGNPRFEYFPISEAGSEGLFNWEQSPPACWW